MSLAVLEAWEIQSSLSAHGNLGVPLTNPGTPWNSWASGEMFQGLPPSNIHKKQVDLRHGQEFLFYSPV